MQAAGKLFLDNYKTAAACTDKQKASLFASVLCKKYLHKTSGFQKEWIRYVCSITPQGLVFLTEPQNFTENSVIIQDDFGFAATVILDKIRQTALSKGYEIITIKNPFLPSIITDHIIIPELSLGFVTENDFLTFGDNSRRIHSVRFTDANQLKQNKQRMNFNKKAIDYLLKCSYATLAEAKAVHDKLESYYINAMDFEKLNDFKEKFCKKLFS